MQSLFYCKIRTIKYIYLIVIVTFNKTNDKLHKMKKYKISNICFKYMAILLTYVLSSQYKNT